GSSASPFCTARSTGARARQPSSCTGSAERERSLHRRAAFEHSGRFLFYAGCPDAIEDAVERVPAVGVGGPYGIEAVELGEVAEAAVGRLGHGPLPAPVTPEALGRVDPEALRRLLAEEARALAGGNGSEKKARGEADGARGRRDEVREVAKGSEVEVPALGREKRRQRRALRHVRRAQRLDALGGGNRASGLVARRQHARLLE